MPKFANSNEKFQWLTTAPIPEVVGRLAVPTIISMLITSIYNMADTYFVGSLGTSAQGAVGVVFSLMAIIQAIGFTFGQGAGSNISRLLGQKRVEEAETVAATGFFWGVLMGLVLTIVGLLFLDPLMGLLGATDTILPHAREYGRFILIGAPWMVGSLVLNNELRFEGNAAYAMMGITTGGILNMLLDPLFIFSFKLGTGGAGLATIVSQLVSFLILFTNSGRRGSLPIRWRRLSWRWETLWKILRGGLPSFYRQGLSSTAAILLNWAAKPFGDAAIAAMAIVTRVNMFCMSALLGFGQGFQPVCGFNYGAKLYGRVRQAFWFCVWVGTAVLAGIAAAGIVLAPQVAYLFQKNDPQVVEMGAMALRCQLAVLPLIAYCICNNMMLQTVGETLRASVLALSRQGLFFIPAILVLPRLLDFTGLMLAQPISDVCTFLLTICMSTGFLRKMRRQEEADKLAGKEE